MSSNMNQGFPTFHTTGTGGPGLPPGSQQPGSTAVNMPGSGESSSKIPNPMVYFDAQYLKTTEGTIQAVCVAISLIAYICVQMVSCGRSGCGVQTFFALVSIFAFWLSLTVLCLYLFHVVERMYNIPWLQIQMVYCGVFSALYFIASFCVVFKGGFFAAAAFFGFIATTVYGMDSYIRFQAYQSGQTPQAPRPVDPAARPTQA